jgi:quercetin dioxygenase-like cupin family protein
MERILTIAEAFAEGGFEERAPGYFIKPVSIPGWRLYVTLSLLQPGNQKARHVHPKADSVIVVVGGEGEYLVDGDEARPVRAGDVCLARAGEVHGMRNSGSETMKWLLVEGPVAPVLETVFSDGRELALDAEGTRVRTKGTFPQPSSPPIK